MRLDVLPVALCDQAVPGGKGGVEQLGADELGPELRCAGRVRDPAFDHAVAGRLQRCADDVELAFDLGLDGRPRLPGHSEHRCPAVLSGLVQAAPPEGSTGREDPGRRARRTPPRGPRACGPTAPASSSGRASSRPSRGRAPGRAALGPPTGGVRRRRRSLQARESSRRSRRRARVPPSRSQRRQRLRPTSHRP